MSSDVRLIMNLIPDRSKHGGEKVPGTVNPCRAFLFYFIMNAYRFFNQKI